MARIDIGQLSQELDKMKTWLETQKLHFENAQKSVEKFQVDTLASFQGEAGDSVRAYAKEVYQPIHMEVMKVESELRPVLDTITNDGKSRFGDNGIVDEEYIQEWSFRFNKYAHQLVDLTQDVNRDLRSVADIIHLELLKTNELEEIHYNTKRHCQRTIEQIDEFDRETNAKIQPIQASVLRLQNMVQEVSSKAPSMSGYQSGSFKFSMLSDMKKYSEEDKKQFVENMKTQYGFDDATVELLWKMWVNIHDKYQDKGEQYCAYVFVRMLSSTDEYLGFGWDDAAGKINSSSCEYAKGPHTTVKICDTSLPAHLRDLGFSEQEINRLMYGLDAQQMYCDDDLEGRKTWDFIFDNKDKNDEGYYYKKKVNMEKALGITLTDEEFKERYTEQYSRYRNKTDFRHQQFVTAVMLNPSSKWTADIVTGGNTDDTAGWFGDLGGGNANFLGSGKTHMGTSDYKSDLDAYNMAERIKRGGSFMENFNNYYAGLHEGSVNRADEFVENKGGMDRIKTQVFGYDKARGGTDFVSSMLFGFFYTGNGDKIDKPELAEKFIDALESHQNELNS